MGAGKIRGSFDIQVRRFPERAEEFVAIRGVSAPDATTRPMTIQISRLFPSN